ncbi:MAG: phosphate/phosphite/phosphonate ABC transporter substrate-binding protein [Gammaproteobacteria bacterium]|nr:phosphate/phosphite/phosphonate ABC transporter substrate-binding protein [Gammaproteobacteria bacterium]MDH5776817.1 phosphate/phosphite/phosphonate ABC transporter substrate-binding protein [Gammaproteobacteria bacterium]
MKLYVTKLAFPFVIGFLTACDANNIEPQLDHRLTETELKQVQSAKTVKENVLVFGFDVRSSMLEDAKQYIPFLSYLEKKTGYKFKLKFTPKHGRIISELGEGKIHFAAIGAASYIKAARKHDVMPLVRGLNDKNRAEYRSYLVVKKDSKLKSLKDISGKRFAFGSRTSTQGHLIPRIIMQEQGIGLADLKKHFYTGSHQNCAEAVLIDKADVCGMQDTMADELATTNSQLRILHRSSYYPSSGIAVNGNVDESIRNKVKKALLEFKPKGRDEENLYNWDKTEMPNGFIEARKKDYQELREWMERLNMSLVNLTTEIAV